MARRNVDLVIRARDEAKTALNAINQALGEFTKNTAEVRDEAARTDTRLDSLGSAFRELRQAVGQLGATGRVEQQLRRITDEINRQEAAITRTEASLRDYSNRFAQTRTQTEQLAATQARLSAELDRARSAVERSRAAQRELAASTGQAQRAQESFTSRQRKLSEQINAQNQRLAEYETRLQGLQAELAQTSTPTATLTRNFERTERAIANTRARIADLVETQNLIQASSDRAAASVQRANDIYGRQAGSLDRNIAALTRVEQAYTETAAAAQASARQQANLEAAARRAAGNLEQQRTSVERARAVYEATQGTLRETAGALNELDAATRRGLLRSLREQITRVADARQSYRELSGEASRLGAALRATEQPTNAQVQAFERFRAAAALARQEFRAQGQALSNLRGILRESGGDVEQLSQRVQRFQSVLQGARGSYAGLQAASNAAATAANRLATEQGRAAQNTGRLQGRTQALAGSMQAGARSTGLFADAIRRFYGETRTALSFTQRLRGEVLSLIAAYGGFFAAIEGIRGVVSAYQTLEQAQNRLGAVFQGDENRQAEELDFIRRQADRLGISFGVLSQEYTKFAVATQGTNLEGEATRRIFRQVAEAGRVQGLSLDNLQGVFVALTQIVSKGTVSMEELRQQLGDRLPGALQILAAGLNKSTDELIKLIENGELSSDSLVAFGDELERRFAGQLPQALEGLNASIGRFQNALFQAFLTIGEGGAIEGFVDLLNRLTESLQSAAVVDFLSRVGGALQQFFNLLGLVVQNWDLLIVAITTFIGLRLAPFIVAIVDVLGRWQAIIRLVQIRTAALTTTVGGLTGAARGGAIAITGLRTALTLLLSSTGIGLLVTLIGTGIGIWATRGTEATEVMIRHREIVDQVKNAYDEVGTSITEVRDRLSNLTQIQVEGQIREAANQFRSALDEFRDAIPRNIFGNVIDNNAIGGFFVQVDRLEQELRSGEISVEEFRDRLETLSVEMRDNIPINAQLAETFDRLARNLVEPSENLEELQDVLVVLTGTPEEAEAALRRLTGTVEETGNEAEQAARRTEEFNGAIRALSEEIPSLKAELDRLDQVDTLARLRDEALALATNTQEAARVLELYDRALRDLDVQAIETVLSGSSPTAVGGGSLVDRIIGAESNGVANARNPLSSATGVGQFIESTWLDLFRRYLPERAESLTRSQILALRTDPQLSRQFVDLYLRELAQQLQAGNLPVTETNLSLSYFLGAGGASTLLRSAPGTLANDVLPENVIAANRGVLDGRTREEVLAWAARRVGLSEQQLAADERVRDVLDDQAQEQQRLAEREAERIAREAEATAERIENAQFEIANQELINVGREREAAIEAAIREARRENSAITEEQLAQVAELAGRQFDVANAERLANSERDRARQIESDIGELVQQRAALTSLLEEQLARGESADAIAETRTALEGVNGQLQEAIQNALQLLLTFDQTDPAVAAIVARLQELELSGAQAGNRIAITFDQVSQAFQGAFTNSVLGFARAIAEGESATQALGNAFRQFASEFLLQIAQMILQQLALNAAQAIGRAFGFGVGIAHSGGVVGARTAGRRVNPAIFAGAARYHMGGIAGLRPGEVPTILQRGEEVLTQNDPRHIFNAGKATGDSAPTITPRIVNAIDGASFMEEAMKTKRGQEVVLNYMQANRSAVRGALGV